MWGRRAHQHITQPKPSPATIPFFLHVFFFRIIGDWSGEWHTRWDVISEVQCVHHVPQCLRMAGVDYCFCLVGESPTLPRRRCNFGVPTYNERQVCCRTFHGRGNEAIVRCTPENTKGSRAPGLNVDHKATPIAPRSQPFFGLRRQ